MTPNQQERSMSATQPRQYSGPFDAPPAHALDGALSWRHISTDDGPGRWKPRGWLVIYPDSLCEYDLDGMAQREATLWAAS